MARRYPQVKSFGELRQLRARVEELQIAGDIPVDDESGEAMAPLFATPFEVGERTVGNRFTVLPMEGWDATPDGAPTDLVIRRWERFGSGGAKLIWGGEAVAVRHDGRANPHQLCLGEHTVDAIAGLRGRLVAAHEQATGRTDDLLVGLQLTHSGRFSRPEGPSLPRTVFRHPALDARVGISDDRAILTDDDLDELVDAFVVAADLAADAGFDFVDVKACHGYLGHELLSAYRRAGRYGGVAVADRARFHITIIERIRARRPLLSIGVRLSIFDLVPFRRGPDGAGVPEWSSAGAADEPHRFGMPRGETEPDVAEAVALVAALREAGMSMLCVTAGSPYYNPHVQRPAYFPPSDGYDPPEDPLVGVARLLRATGAVKAAHPDLVVVGSGYSYLQDWLPRAAHAQLRVGNVDSIGLGRMALSYPDLPADVLAGRSLDRRRVCRTFSDCTTAPRHGLISGCYPLDDFYKALPERIELAAIKRRGRAVARPGGDGG